MNDMLRRRLVLHLGPAALYFLSLLAWSRGLAAPVQASDDFGRPERGLSLKISTKRAAYKVGDAIDVAFTFKNVANKDIRVLDGPYEFHQFEFGDGAGKAISQTTPTSHHGKRELLRGKLAPGATIEHVVRLNAWKLAGLGHPYTEIGKEVRTITVMGLYSTPAGLDLKDAGVWLGGTLRSNTISIKIEK
jgi:hypothetical protein